MAVKEEKILQEAGKLLRDAGYTVGRGMWINFSLAEAADKCGGTCSGGCRPSCYTCTGGSSNPKISRMDPRFEVLTRDILEDLVTIIRTQERVEEKKEKK